MKITPTATKEQKKLVKKHQNVLFIFDQILANQNEAHKSFSEEYLHEIYHWYLKLRIEKFEQSNYLKTSDLEKTVSFKKFRSLIFEFSRITFSDEKQESYRLLFGISKKGKRFTLRKIQFFEQFTKSKLEKRFEAQADAYFGEKNKKVSTSSSPISSFVTATAGFLTAMVIKDVLSSSKKQDKAPEAPTETTQAPTPTSENETATENTPQP